MINKVHVTVIALTMAFVCFNGCASPTIEYARNLKEKPQKKEIGPKFKGYWNENPEATGAPRIVISLGEQKASFYKGDILMGEAPISTGREGYETKPGEYKVLQKEMEHYSNLYGEFVTPNGKIVGYGSPKDTPPPGTKYEPSPMPHYLRITYDGTGLHAGFLPGYPASHGCIRLPAVMAQKFYENASVDTKVTIVP